MSLFKGIFIFQFSYMNKAKYGDVSTDRSLVLEIMSLIPEEIFRNPNLRWLDPGAGNGIFSQVLYEKLLSFSPSNHIIKNMIYMIECNPENILLLRESFGEEANIIEADFLSWQPPFLFDMVIGNPPFNSNGLKKVPTNTKLDKKKDGKTIWRDFVRHSISLLKDGGRLNMIVPSLWMRCDRDGMHDYLKQYRLENIHCFTNTETNRLFHGKAQTPTCYFLLTKEESDQSTISLYDKQMEKMVEFPRVGNLPVYGSSIMKKLLSYVEKVGYLTVKKTNMPRKNIKLSPVFSMDFPYKNIKTCIFASKKQPELKYSYSEFPLYHYGIRKVVLAHKMYGFPYYDEEGEFGISNRDNYVIQNVEGMEKWVDFLSTKLARYIFRSTRYRMMYLEREAFQYIPDIMKLENFPLNNITNKSVCEYFGLDEKEREVVELEGEYHRCIK